MRTNVEENRELGSILAAKVNQSTGPIKILLPLRGVSQLDSPGGEFWWPEADRALFSSLRRHLRSDISVIDLDANINDPVAATDPRQDDYDIWLGTVTLDKWVPWNRHGTPNVLYLDGHAKSVAKPEAYLGMYPGGAILTNPSWYP